MLSLKKERMVWNVLRQTLNHYDSVFFDVNAILSLALLPHENYKGQYKRTIKAQKHVLSALRKKETYITKAIANELKYAVGDELDPVKVVPEALSKTNFRTFDFNTTHKQHTNIFVQLLNSVVSHEDRFAQHLAALIINRKKEIEQSKDIVETLKPMLEEAKSNTLFDFMRKKRDKPKPGDEQHPYHDLDKKALEKAVSKVDILLEEWESRILKPKELENKAHHLRERSNLLKKLLRKGEEGKKRQLKKPYNQFVKEAVKFSQIVAERDEQEMPEKIEISKRLDRVLRAVHYFYTEIARTDHFIVNESIFHMLFVTGKPTLLVTFDEHAVTYAECLYHALALMYFLKYPFKHQNVEKLNPGELLEEEMPFPPKHAKKVMWSIFDHDGNLHSWEYPADFSEIVSTEPPKEFDTASDFVSKNKKGYSVVEKLT